MDLINKELQMPMYITEYDIASTDDNKQLKQYKAQIPYMWEADYCAGVTLWGFIYGKTWTDNGKGYSGIVKNGVERPALTWLREYMASDAAKNAKIKIVIPKNYSKEVVDLYKKIQELS